MKKTFAIVVCAAAMLLAGKANAQLGINVGYAPVTLSSTFTSGNTSTTSTTEMNGFFVGATYNYGIQDNLGVAFGLDLRYNTKTTTTSSNLVVVSGSGKYHYTQLLFDVPVLINYSFPLGSEAKLTAFAGPAFSFAVSGNTHVTTTNTVAGATSTSESDSDWYGNNSTNNRFDLTAALGVQFQYSQFRLFGGYRLGLIDLDSDDNVKTTSAGLFVGLGFSL